MEEKSRASSSETENENAVQNLDPKPEHTAMEPTQLEPSARTGDEDLNPKPENTATDSAGTGYENTATDQTQLEKLSAGTGDGSPDEVAQVRDWRFWMVFVALSTTGLLSAVEGTIISTALPTIVHNLNIGSNYAWVSNAYFLTRSVQ
jgi:hypothetical protein